MTIEEVVIYLGFAHDVEHAGRLARDLHDPAYSSFTPIVTLCLAPYLSLFVHESYRKLQTLDPELAELLSDDVESIVKRSRHSLKLFEDTKRGVAGQIAYFRDELLPAHTHYFLDNPPPILQPFVNDLKDLGLFSYDGRLIATSHSTNFHLGIESLRLLEATSAERRAIYEKYGEYFGHFGARLDGDKPTFISDLDPKRFNQDIQDVRADEYYRSVFDGNGDPALNAVLTVFRCMMNFVGSVMATSADVGDIEYTVFKIRFLALYQVLGSLSVLRDEYANLTSQSTAYIEKITGTAEAQLIMNPVVKPFRNTLMHYNLDRVDTTRVDVHQPLFGLVPVFFPAYDLANFAAVIDRCITETAAAMDEWAGSRRQSSVTATDLSLFSGNDFEQAI